MIRDKYLKQLVDIDDGRMAQLVNMDEGLEEPFQCLTAKHEEIRNPLLRVIRDRKSSTTLYCMVEFKKQCRKILEKLEENGPKTVAGARAGLFIASLMGTVAKVRAELFVTSLIDRGLHRVLVRNGEGDPGGNEEKYQRIWEQFKYIRLIGHHGDHLSPWYWFCDDHAEENIRFLKDYKALIAEIAREYWEDFLKNVVVEDTDKIVKKVGQSFWKDIEENEEYHPLAEIKELIKPILQDARMLLFGPPPLHIPLEHLA